MDQERKGLMNDGTVFGVVTRVRGENGEPVRIVRKRFEDSNGLDDGYYAFEMAKFMAQELNKRHHPRGTNDAMYWVEDVTGQGDNEDGYVPAGGAFHFDGDIDGVRTDRHFERQYAEATDLG